MVGAPHQAHQVPGGHDLEGALELLPKVSRDKCALRFFRKTVVRTSVPEEAGVAEEHSGSHEEGSSQEGLMPLPPSTVQHRGKKPNNNQDQTEHERSVL